MLEGMGHAGVDLFFVLSGYLIYGSVVTRYQPFLPFIGRRLQRIYPAFAATFAMYVVLSLLFPFEMPMFGPTFEHLNAWGLPQAVGYGPLPTALAPHAVAARCSGRG